MEALFNMNPTAISLYCFASFLLLASFSSALEFQFNSPSEVSQNETFYTSIIASTSDSYDVKIFVYDDSKEYSEIYDGTEWKNPYYYLKSVFPQMYNYSIISHYTGDANICARLRKTGGSSYTEVCNPIKVKAASQSSPSQDQTAASAAIVTNLSLSSGATNNSVVPIEQDPVQNQVPVVGEEKIVLNAKSAGKINSDAEFITSKEKIRLWLVYSFTALCIVIIIILLIKGY